MSGILFYHDTKDDGMVAMSEMRVAGQRTPERRYIHKGHFLEVNAPHHAQEHDQAELQKLGYRLATPKEQNEFVKQQKRAGTLEE
jgi:hypothetical protein